MVPLTNNKKSMYAALTPTPQAIMQISNTIEGIPLKTALDTLKNNNPLVCYVDKEIFGAGVETTDVYMRDTTDSTACHLLGYTDSTGHGVTGLELFYDEFLYSDKKVSAIFTTDGKGKVLKGVDPYFENDLSVVLNGVVTTIDINMQRPVENAVSKLDSGCAIVAEVSSGKVRAMASVPTFNMGNLAQSLTDPNSPMLNRALCAFNVGSVFKPAVAAAALENNFHFSFNCEGSTIIGDRAFKCHNLSGHGNMNLCDSLAQSCNCFFYNLALQIGSAPIYKMANSLSLGTKIKIADNMYTSSGNIPKLNTLTSDGALANLSIGQGVLTASPVAMLNLYLAIAGDGSYYIPSIVEKTIKDGAESFYDAGSPTKVMSSETASILREYLQKVITDGTGIEAAPQYVTAAGKTATAQTGRRDEDGVEITNSWFCGFFPVQQPEYVVIVISDSKSSVSTSSIFAQITDEIAQYTGKYVNFND